MKKYSFLIYLLFIFLLTVAENFVLFKPVFGIISQNYSSRLYLMQAEIGIAVCIAILAANITLVSLVLSNLQAAPTKKQVVFLSLIAPVVSTVATLASQAIFQFSNGSGLIVILVTIIGITLENALFATLKYKTSLSLEEKHD